MCHQTVGLAQAEVEQGGIPTVSVTMLPEVTRKIRVPRAVEVPYPLGFPFGGPGDAAGQRAVLKAMLDILDQTDVPVLTTFKQA